MNKLSSELKLYKNKRIGNWILMSRLGNGGNGEVWKCKSEDGNRIAAVKFLMHLSRKSYQRFKDEISVQERIANEVNVMPVLDKSLPKFTPIFDIGKTPLYYVMPLGTPLSKELKTLSFEKSLVVIEALLSTVVNLHAKSIAHRDIKVDNIIKLNDRYVLSDFGLVFYKGKKRITRFAEKIGAKTSIAPEMERPGSDKADAFKADVYSIAKVIWIILTNNLNSFEGQYFKDMAIALTNYRSLSRLNIYWFPLEMLLRNCTDHNPLLRPTANEMLNQLHYWEDINKNENFAKRCAAEWDEVTNDLFPYSKPSSVYWTDARSAVSVLNIISKYNNLNHLFFPQGGGFDLISAKVYCEPDWIEICIGACSLILKLKRLSFYSFDDNNNWNYFRIEVSPVEALFGSADEYQQRLIETSPMQFASSEVETHPEYYPEYNISDLYRIIIRCHKGDFVIFNKVSTYNTDKTQDSYDGRHALLSSDKYRQYIETCAMRGKLLDIREFM